MQSREGISVTLKASRDSSQPFCVGKSGVGGISSGALSGVVRNVGSNLSLPLLLVLVLMLLIVVLKFVCRQYPVSHCPGFFFLGVVRQYSRCG